MSDQLNIFTLERQKVGKQVQMQWIDPRLLQPNPDNPRRRESVLLESYIESMKVEGFRPDKPLLVRPVGDTYQIVGGHSTQTQP